MKNSKMTFLLPWIICFLATFFYCYEYVLRIMPANMQSSLFVAFNLNAKQFANIVSSYYYAYVPLQIITGFLLDKYGPRNTLLMAILNCVIGAVFFAVTDTVTGLIVARFLMGFGSAFAFVGVLKLASIWLPANKFSFVSGLTTMSGMLTAMYAGIFINDYTEFLGWRTVSYYSGIMGLILLPIFFLVVRNKQTLDDAESLLSLSDFKRAILGLLSKPIFWLIGYTACILYLPTIILTEFVGKIFLMQTHFYSPKDATVIISYIFMGWVLGAPFWGYISDNIIPSIKILIISAFSTSVILLLMPFLDSGVPWSILMLLVGLSSSGQVTAFGLAKMQTENTFAGLSVSLTNCFVMMSGFLGPLFFSSILDALWAGEISNGVPLYSANSYYILFYIMSAFSALSCFMLILNYKYFKSIE